VANELPNNLPPKKLWIEKTPGNELYFPFLKKIFPKAKFIHIIRDPLENLVSLQKLTGIRNWSAFIEEHALKMKRHFQIAKNNYERNIDRYCIVKYENLISNPETSLREICKFLHIKFENNLLIPTENGVAATSNSMFKQSRVQGKFLDQSQKTRYKKYLDYSTTLNIISLIQKETNYFDYEWEVDGIESNQLSWQGRIQRMGDKAVLVYFLSLCPKMNVGANLVFAPTFDLDHRFDSGFCFLHPLDTPNMNT